MPTRVGDSWVYDLTTGPLTSTPVTENLGVIPVDEYQILISGRLGWSDPLGASVVMEVSAALDVDCYDAAGELLPSWDGGVYPRVNQSYQTVAGTKQEAVFVELNVAALDPGTASVRVSRSGQTWITTTNTQGPPLNLELARVSFVIVTIV